MMRHIGILLAINLFVVGLAFSAPEDIVKKPVKAVAETTSTVVDAGYQATDDIVFKTGERIIDGTTELLPGDMDFVSGNEYAEEDAKNPGPKFKMNF